MRRLPRGLYRSQSGNPCRLYDSTTPHAEGFFPMGLFTADLYRSFAIGFGLGALMLALTVGSQLLTAF
jgi:hypothetical protein